MEKKDKYYKKVNIPVRIIEKIDKTGYLRKNVKKAGYLGLISVLILVQIQGFSAFEAHIINITARICKHSETRTMGYWKNHEEVYLPHLPQYLGNEEIQTIEDAEDVNEVFDNANADADVMIDMLKGQLLAMKFNIAHFGIGDYLVESEGETINDIVDKADALLILEGTRSEMEEVKNILDYLNNLHQIRYCSDVPEHANFEAPIIQSGFSLPQGIIPGLGLPDPILETTTPSDDGVLAPEEILGCMDSEALNYNAEADTDDGSCVYPESVNQGNKDKDKDKGKKDSEEILGCLDSSALNYNSEATIDDESCEYEILGCMDLEALNYNPYANTDNGLCEYALGEEEEEEEITGCIDSEAENYNLDATLDNGSCTYLELEPEL